MNKPRFSNLHRHPQRLFWSPWILPLLLLALPPAAKAQFNYIITNGAVTITGYTGAVGAVTIPATINSFPVVSVGDYAFAWNSGVLSVIIPNGVTNLGNYAFFRCYSLSSCELPSSLVTIGSCALYECALSSVVIPEQVISIGDAAFLGCGLLRGITIPNSVLNLSGSAFMECTSLTNVTIGSSVTNIEDWAFYRCTSLTTLRIPNNVRRVGVATFSYCSLTNVILGNGLTNIADQAFSFCTNLREIYFQGNAPSLGGSQVFNGDGNATVYYLPGTTGWGATFGGRPTAPYVLPPTIQAPPQTQTAEADSAVEFRVTAVGGLLRYQWFLAGTNRLSRTNAVLQLPAVQYAEAGAYTVVVTNAAGSVTSPPALLNVIALVERRLVPALSLMGQPGTTLNLDFTAALRPAQLWATFDHVPLTAAPQWYFDLNSLVPPQGFYRAWQTNAGVPPALNLHFVPALTLTGAIGSSQRIDYINQFGPIDAWVTNLATVTLTNTSQLYLDTSSIGQPARLYRIVPGP